MRIITGKNANDLVYNATKALLRSGKEVSPRGLKTLEIEHAWMQLYNPVENIITLKARNLSLPYLNAEMNWYLNGDLNAEEISKASGFWKNLCDSSGNVNSNYGYLALRELHNGKSQFDWCVDRLKEDPDTRQAVINYNQPRHKYEGNKDFVCTIAQSFRLNGGKLDSTTLMRSNDLIYGFSYDLPWFTHLQKQVASEIGARVGQYNHYAASLHVYERHFPMLDDIVNEVEGTNDLFV